MGAESSPGGEGEGTLVLQGTEPLLGLCVQLFQVRRPPTGEEDIVLVLIHRRPWPLAGPYT